MDVLVAGDQMGVLSGACGRFELVSCQHPNLHRHQRVTCSGYFVFWEGFMMHWCLKRDSTQTCNYMKENGSIISLLNQLTKAKFQRSKTLITDLIKQPVTALTGGQSLWTYLLIKHALLNFTYLCFKQKTNTDGYHSIQILANWFLMGVAYRRL